jgi:hypothetical protein
MPIFRRQHPIGRYVLDFYCTEARLAIEIDGLSHDPGDRPQRDVSRDAWLKTRGLTVMRIGANEVMRDADEAADAIVRLATELIQASTPSTALARGPLPRFAGEERAPLMPNPSFTVSRARINWTAMSDDHTHP